MRTTAKATPTTAPTTAPASDMVCEAFRQAGLLWQDEGRPPGGQACKQQVCRPSMGSSGTGGRTGPRRLTVRRGSVREIVWAARVALLRNYRPGHHATQAYRWLGGMGPIGQAGAAAGVLCWLVRGSRNGETMPGCVSQLGGKLGHASERSTHHSLVSAQASSAGGEQPSHVKCRNQARRGRPTGSQGRHLAARATGRGT